jgi:hypothetical protein
MPTTITRGPASTGTPPESEIAGKHCMIMSTKKYKLAILENYSYKFLGTKLRQEYFTVEILFPINFSGYPNWFFCS